MATQRMLTFEVIPVQGRFYIYDMDEFAPKSYYEAPDRIVYNKVVT
jgi:hypothetical protein